MTPAKRTSRGRSAKQHTNAALPSIPPDAHPDDISTPDISDHTITVSTEVSAAPDSSDVCDLSAPDSSGAPGPSDTPTPSGIPDPSDTSDPSSNCDASATSSTSAVPEASPAPSMALEVSPTADIPLPVAHPDALTPAEALFVAEAEAADRILLNRPADLDGDRDVDEAELADGIGYSDASPVALSMLNAMDPTLIVGRQLLATADLHRPHVTNKMQDNAKYWLTKTGEVLVMRLPCLVDTAMQGVKTGKYFDLYGEEITDDKFKKLRAVFGFRSLPDDGEEYPPEVLKAASAAQKLLYKLQTKYETSMSQRQQPSNTRGTGNVRGFYKAETAQDCFQYLIRSEPIFTPAGDPTGSVNGVPTIDLTGDTDSDSSADLVFSSPSKLRAQAASKSAAYKAPQGAAPGYTLGDWAQPAYSSTRYYHFVGDRTHLWASRFNIPEIRNQNGVIVHPTEWDTVLTHLAPVTVDFVLKLWDIPAGRGREASRIYQLVLRKVQLHPCNSLSSIIVHSASRKGKKRAACTDLEDSNHYAELPPSPTKKSKASRSTELGGGDEDVIMGV